jgi:hypothetical protein
MAQTAGAINGTIVLLYVGSTAVAAITECSFDLKHSPREATSKDSTNGSSDFLEGRTSWTASSNNLFAFDSTYGFQELFAAWTNRTKLTIKFATVVAENYEYSGSAYITGLTANFPDQETTTYSVEMQGTGVFAEATTSA